MVIVGWSLSVKGGGTNEAARSDCPSVTASGGANAQVASGEDLAEKLANPISDLIFVFPKKGLT